MKSIRIDRERAIRTGALAALIMLTVTFLPGLLRSPKPPPVPADVGFTPAETGTSPAGLPSIPGSGLTANQDSAGKNRSRGRAGGKDAPKASRKSGGGTGRKRRRTGNGRGRSGAAGKGGKRKRPAGAPQPAAPPSGSQVAAPPAPPPPPAAPAAPPPAAPVAAPAPAPTRTAPQGRPADGSQEFAPR